MNNPWLNLIAAWMIHLSIGSVYAWSTLVIPIENATGWDKASITFAFSIIILFLSIAAFLTRRLYAHLGLSYCCLISTFLFSIGYELLSLGVEDLSLNVFYLGAVITGLGTGIGYILPVDLIMQWFPKRKGLSGGSCIMAFGFGSALAAPCFNYLCGNGGPGFTFALMGCLYFFVMFISSYILSLPDKEDGSSIGVVYYNEDKFRKLFLAFYLNIACGISLLSLISPIVQDLGADVGFATMVVSLIGIANGGGRIFWAAISDKLGRDRTYQILFVLEAFFFVGLAMATNYYIFTILAFVLITIYGGGFSVMPAFVADAFKYPLHEGQEESTVVRIHGKVLLAWGLAGISAPMFLAYTYQYIGYNGVFLLFGILFGIGSVLRRIYKV